MRCVELNLDIYPLKYIEQAIHDYSSITKISCYIDNNMAVLNFKCDLDKLEIVENEFCNYVIALIGRVV